MGFNLLSGGAFLTVEKKMVYCGCGSCTSSQLQLHFNLVDKGMHFPQCETALGAPVAQLVGAVT